MGFTGSASPLMRYWQVKVSICEFDDRTQARAVLRLEPAREVEATGRSTRDPGSPSIPRIGDEVAVARALRGLADQLLEVASGDLARYTGEPEVELRPR
jgi:hypothetical protein